MIAVGYSGHKVFMVVWRVVFFATLYTALRALYVYARGTLKLSDFQYVTCREGGRGKGRGSMKTVTLTYFSFCLMIESMIVGA